MVQSLAKLLLGLLLIPAISSLINYEGGQLICSEDTSIEPSVSDVFATVFPDENDINEIKNTFVKDLGINDASFMQSDLPLQNILNDLSSAISSTVSMAKDSIESATTTNIVNHEIHEETAIDADDLLTNNDESHTLLSSISNNKIEDMPYYLLNASYSTAKAIGNVKIPLVSVISEGNYVITSSNRNIPFSEIVLIQKNHYFLTSSCSAIYDRHASLSSLQSRLCACYSNSYDLSVSKDKLIPPYIKDLIMRSTDEDWPNSSSAIMNGTWCISYGLCSSKDNNNNRCTIAVDPLRPSCLWVPNSKAKVAYELVTPMLSSVHYLYNLIDSIVSLFTDDSTVSSLFSPLNTIVNEVTKYVPLYVVKLCIGAIIINKADDLASMPLFHYTIVLLLGTFVAIAILALNILKASDNFFRQMIPGLLQSLFTSLTILSGFVYLGFRNDSLYMIAYNFWLDGVFGYEYAGKLYFISIGVICMVCTWYFNLFRPNSVSGSTLVHLIKSVGACFVYLGSPNIELSIAMLILIFSQSNVQHFMYMVYLKDAVRNQKTSLELTGRRLTAAEYDAEAKDFTARELEKLRSHLKQNPDERKLFNRDSPYRSANILVNRFANGDYSGLPEEEARFRKSKKHGHFKGITAAVILIAVIAAIYKMNSDSFEL